MLRTLPALFRASCLVPINTKTSTGLTGVPVIPNARVILKDLYERILVKAEELPADLPYRIDIENLVNHRINIINEEEDCAVIEERIACDQIEMLIHKARNELNEGMPTMIELAPWKENGWQEKQIPIVIREIGDGSMDLTSFSEEEMKNFTRRDEIEKELAKQEAEKQKKE